MQSQQSEKCLLCPLLQQQSSYFHHHDFGPRTTMSTMEKEYEWIFFFSPIYGGPAGQKKLPQKLLPCINCIISPKSVIYSQLYSSKYIYIYIYMYMIKVAAKSAIFWVFDFCGHYRTSVISWLKMGFIGLHWTSLDFSGLQWTSVDFSGLQWTSVDFSGLQWTSVDFSGLQWTLLDFSGL
jgi:hypothetical protein